MSGLISGLSSLCCSNSAPEAADKTFSILDDDKKPFKDWPNDAGFNTTEEHRSPIELQVVGQIPRYAAGTLYRTGPAQYKLSGGLNGDFKSSHWFDGFSQVYRFELSATDAGSCTVNFSSRRQTDEILEKARENGRLEGISFGQKRDPCDSFFRKLKTTFETPRSSLPGCSNIAVTIAPNVPGLTETVSSNSRIRSLSTFTDNSRIKSLDPQTLEPIGVTDQSSLHPTLRGALSAAHAEFDHITGDVYNYNLDLTGPAKYHVFHTSALTGETTILATLTGKDVKAAYVHSFFLTPSHVLLVVWPAHFSAGGLSILWNRNILDSISPFDAAAPTKWFVIDRLHGRGHIATYESPAFFAFHSINAWEEEAADGTVDLYADIVQYPNLDILHKFYYENLTSTGRGASEYSIQKGPTTRGTLARYKLSEVPGKPSGDAPGSENLKQCGVAEKIVEVSAFHAGELPTINPRFQYRKQRFVYGVSDRGASSFVDGIIKSDIETGTSKVWSVPRHTPGEAIFIPNPGLGSDGDSAAADMSITDMEEDDGVLLSVVLDADLGRSYLLCLDAKDLTELGRAEVPAVVGFGFHGRHMGL